MIYGTLTSTTPPGQNEPGSNDNESKPYNPQSFWTGASPSNGLALYPGHSEKEVLLFCRDATLYSTVPANWIVSFN